MSAEDIAKAFCSHYYQSRDTNLQALAGLYQEASMMTYEGAQVQGGTAIIQKLQSTGRVAHQVKGMDVQPSAGQNAILIFVTGAVRIGENPGSIHFCQMFQLVATAPGNYYVHNDIFRLNYGL